MLGWLRLGDLLDLPALAQGELQRVATLVPRVQRIESVGVEITDHIAHSAPARKAAQPSKPTGQT
jgi:hypothetical protein